MKRYFAALVALVAVVSTSQPAYAAVREEHFAILRQGEIVGALHALTRPEKGGKSRISVDYKVVNNGRGPTLNETIVLDRDGLPIEWKIAGTTTYGGAVAEHFAYSSSVARWESTSEQGTSRTARLYVPKDASPWRLGFFARALLNAPGHQMAALPSGALRLERLRRIDTGRPDIVATLYRLSGADLSPDYVVLDSDGRLFAHLASGGIAVRQGFENLEPQLRALVLTLQRDRATELQRKLSHRFGGPVHIENVRVFDSRTGRVGEPGSVIIKGDRIAEVAGGMKARAGETVIDAEGGTLVPGLFNMHMHDSIDSGLMLIATGVTSVRDMGNDNLSLPALVSAIDAGSLAGPRITMAGLIEGRSPYSARIGRVASTLPEALEAVRWYAEHGYRQIKLYSSVDPDWVKPLVDEARRLGMRTTGHVPAFSSADRVIREGFSDIAHVNQLMLSWLLNPAEDTRSAFRITALSRAKELDLASKPVRETLALMKEHDVRLDTTIMVFERLLLSRAGKDPAGDVSYIGHMPVGHQRVLRSDFTKVKDAAEAEAYQAAFERMLSLLKLLHEQGIQLMPGTDDIIETGFGLHRELELYAQAGIPPGEVLQLATLKAAQYLGTDQSVGSIETGKLADFFLVPGDPTSDISKVRNVRMVVRGGQVYFPAEIYRELGIEPFTGAPPLRPAAQVAATPGVAVVSKGRRLH